jgi:hypothetical protein
MFLVTFGNHHLMSFISSLHVDTNDVPSHLQGAISDCIERHKTHQDEQVQNALSYLRQWLEEGIGVCTTCVYQFVGRESLDPEDEIYSYFLMDGIRLGVRIETHVAHSFFAHAYSHCTPLSFIVRNIEGERRVFYHLDNFQVFAWGGGGSNDVNTATNVVIDGRRPRRPQDNPPPPPPVVLTQNEAEDNVSVMTGTSFSDVSESSSS